MKAANVAPLLVERDPRWRALRARDAAFDGRFFYSVKTTGVYCKPSCAARPPRPENVAFHGSAREAERAGFRACKRCKPDRALTHAPSAELVARLCRWIESSDEPPSLAALAAQAGLSASHTHRLFKSVTGLTPRAYAAAARGQRLREELRNGGNVTQAIYRSGYNSSGRFYADVETQLGMTPSQYQARGRAQPIRFALGQCSLGHFLVAATERGVCAISLGDDPDELLHELERRFASAELIGQDAEFEAHVARVVALIEDPSSRVSLPLDLQGTAFQRRVWAALSAIPAGKTKTYTEIAEAIGDKRAVRAVAGACAANTLAIAIPCHRVVRSDGSLSGYRWGVERKRLLLERERNGSSVKTRGR